MACVSWLLFIATCLAGILSIVYIRFKISYRYWKKKGVLFLKPAFPTGNCKSIVLVQESLGDVFEKLYFQLTGNKFGGIYLLNKPLFLLRDPDLIKTFLVKDFDHFPDHGLVGDESVDPFAANLFLLKGKRWKDMRNKLSPTFTSGKLKVMFDTMANSAVHLIDHLEEPARNGEKVEMKDISAKYTTDIIASCAYGITSNCLKNPDAEMMQWARKLWSPGFESIARGLLYTLAPNFAIKWRISGNPQDLIDFFRGLVRDTVSYRENYGVNRKDFLQQLIKVKNEGFVDEDDVNKGEKNGITMDEIAAHVFIFFLAAFDTSSTTMSFCLYELSLNPDIQVRLRKEIDLVLEKHGGKVTYEAIQEMDYLDKVISETLRKYPPGPFLHRTCSKDYQIPDTSITIDEGTVVIIPTQGLHYDPQYFPDPRRFDPERFNEENKNKRHRYAYLPFGDGPRICIGMRFGLLETKIGLVSLLSNYEFHVCSKTVFPIERDPTIIFTQAKGGIWLQIDKRTDKN